MQTEFRQFCHGLASDGVFLACEVPPDGEGRAISGEGGSARKAPGGPGLTTWVDVRVTCSENIRTDEAILRRGVPAVRAAVLTDRAVSYGVGVHAEAAYLVPGGKGRRPNGPTSPPRRDRPPPRPR